MADLATILSISIPPVLGVAWAAYEAWAVTSVKLETPSPLREHLNRDVEGNNSTAKQLSTMIEVSEYIARGANAFLFKEYQYLAVYIVVFAVILGVATDLFTVAAFIVGALTSIACGFIGMKIAVYANVRTAYKAWHDLAPAYEVAVRAGSVMGFVLVSLGVVTLWALILVFRVDAFGLAPVTLFEAIAGYGLGGSSIALFARVGGGIYTKAADVGADLSGKTGHGIDEDDPRNPACIADNVGDNVGDIAGMGADLFGSLAESTCAALIIAANSSLATNFSALMFPLTLSSLGIVVGIITMVILRFAYPVRRIDQIETALKLILAVSTALMAPLVVVAAYFFLPATFALNDQFPVVAWWAPVVAIQMGLWSGLIVGFITEYYTSHSYGPVRAIAQTQATSAATGIIAGLALGYLSTIVPVVCLCATVAVAYSLSGMYGIALAAIGMLGTLTMGLTIDAYGPISDNAGGIAEMSKLGREVRARTDALDAAGNTTAAIGKGFAIGSAALVSLALFSAYCVRANIIFVNILDPWTFVGLLFGAMLPYAFSALTMKSVGDAADEMVKECNRQFPLILSGKAKPDYEICITISTSSAIREMILPGVLTIGSPIVAGMLFGKYCTAGLLAGILVSGIQLAISAANSGGAWDNSKKYIEAGGLAGHAKGSDAHKNAVTGDTVGDPLKDTSGPSLNILVKLSAIISLVFGSVIANTFTNASGGPIWLPAGLPAIPAIGGLPSAPVA